MGYLLKLLKVLMHWYSSDLIIMLSVVVKSIRSLRLGQRAEAIVLEGTQIQARRALNLGIVDDGEHVFVVVVVSLGLGLDTFGSASAQATETIFVVVVVGGDTLLAGGAGGVGLGGGLAGGLLRLLARLILRGWWGGIVEARGSGGARGHLLSGGSTRSLWLGWCLLARGLLDGASVAVAVVFAIIAILSSAMLKELLLADTQHLTGRGGGLAAAKEGKLLVIDFWLSFEALPGVGQVAEVSV